MEVIRASLTHIDERPNLHTFVIQSSGNACEDLSMSVHCHLAESEVHHTQEKAIRRLQANFL
jgi:hypothetical protein